MSTYERIARERARKFVQSMAWKVTEQLSRSPDVSHGKRHAPEPSLFLIHACLKAKRFAIKLCNWQMGNITDVTSPELRRLVLHKGRLQREIQQLQQHLPNSETVYANGEC